MTLHRMRRLSRGSEFYFLNMGTQEIYDVFNLPYRLGIYCHQKGYQWDIPKDIYRLIEIQNQEYLIDNHSKIYDFKNPNNYLGVFFPNENWVLSRHLIEEVVYELPIEFNYKFED